MRICGILPKEVYTVRQVLVGTVATVGTLVVMHGNSIATTQKQSRTVKQCHISGKPQFHVSEFVGTIN